MAEADINADLRVMELQAIIDEHKLIVERMDIRHAETLADRAVDRGVQVRIASALERIAARLEADSG